MDIDGILAAVNRSDVDCILIGGVNFMLRHIPELTFDLDLWVKDDDDNLRKLNAALRELKAEWGQTEAQWAPVPENFSWLKRQDCFCLTTTLGALDVFREVRGLEGQYDRARQEAIASRTKGGQAYFGLSDRDMLRCQEVLPVGQQKQKRIEVLRKVLDNKFRNPL